MTRKDFQNLAKLRAVEARLLARSGKEEGAYYFAGMAIECALKACIAKKTKRHDFPPDKKQIEKVYTHDLAQLLRLAGLEGDLDADAKNNAVLGRNWSTVKNWNNDSRYQTSGLNGKDMHAASIGPDGVLTWIKRRW